MKTEGSKRKVTTIQIQNSKATKHETTANMSSKQATLNNFDPLEAARRYIQQATRRCKSRGKLILESGSFSNKRFSVSAATDSGAKTENEDYVALFQSDSHPQEIAIAIADGVGSSLLSEVAAKLACVTALGMIATAKRFDDAFPIQTASRVLRRIGSRIKNASSIRLPDSVCPSMWDAAVEYQKVFQTTLTVIWTDDEQLKILSLADGGILASATDEEVKFMKLNEHCIGIGPFVYNVAPRALLFDELDCLSVFTDGFNELAEDNIDFRDQLVGLDGRSAKESMETGLREHSEYIEDNTTLCQVRWLRD